MLICQIDTKAPDYARNQRKLAAASYERDDYRSYDLAAPGVDVYIKTDGTGQEKTLRVADLPDSPNTRYLIAKATASDNYLGFGAWFRRNDWSLQTGHHR